MLGIKQIASCIPDTKISNYDRKEEFDLNNAFIKEKIGFESLSVKDKEQKSSQLCLKAFENLAQKPNLEEIDCVILVSQNPDYRIPHTSAILHKDLKLSQNCACFDIGLGCSGYVYGLSVILAFMRLNNLKQGLLFTCDPYSNIIKQDDKNTAILFGDGASVTHISKDFILKPKTFKFGTDGKGYESIFCPKDTLSMNGRDVFNFAAQVIPKHIENFLNEQGLNKEDIDMFLLHQGSKYIVDNIAKRLSIDLQKVPFLAASYGNTVSSSLPLMLENIIKEDKKFKNLLISGFGTGLSWGSSILTKE